MLELGVSHIPVYSKLFNDMFDNNCVNICTEVLESRLNIAKQKFPNGIFYQTYSGLPMHLREATPSGVEIESLCTIPFKTLLTQNNIEYVDILHVDIQGSEVSLLQELNQEKLYEKIEWFFISIHDCYEECLDQIKDWDAKLIFAHPTLGGWGDGLIIIKNNTARTTH